MKIVKGKRNNKIPAVLDLFSGCGGLSYGFMNKGFNIVAGIDNWEDALITFEKNHPGAKGMVRIKINRLIPNPNQPRKTFFEQTISELAESIKEHGVLSPILVRPQGKKYEIIAGERRFKAARQAGLKEVPAIIKNVSNGDARIISLIENIQREDLNDIDRASALRELKVNLGLPWVKIAKRLGLTKSRVLDLVGLLDLPEEIKKDIQKRNLTEKHGRALRQLLNQAEILREAASFIKEKKLTGDQSLGLVRKVKGQPGLTIQQSYESLEEEFPKKKKETREPVKIAVSEGMRLVRTLAKIKLNKMKVNEKEAFKATLLVIKNKIEELLEN